LNYGIPAAASVKKGSLSKKRSFLTSFLYLDFSKTLLAFSIEIISGVNGVAAALKFFIEDATKNLFLSFHQSKELFQE